MLDLIAQIKEEVDKKVANEESFTAWDITQLIRNQFPKDNVPHPTVRVEIRALMNNIPNYERRYSGANGYSTYVPTKDTDGDPTEVDGTVIGNPYSFDDDADDASVVPNF